MQGRDALGMLGANSKMDSEAGNLVPPKTDLQLCTLSDVSVISSASEPEAEKSRKRSEDKRAKVLYDKEPEGIAWWLWIAHWLAPVLS